MNKQWMLSLSQLFYSGYASGHRGRWDLEYHVTSAHPTTMLLSSLQAVCPASGNQSFGWFKSIIAVTFPLARNWSKMEVHVCETHVWPMRWMRCKGKCTRDSRKDFPLPLRHRERIPCLPPRLLFYFRYCLWEYDAWKWSSHLETMRQVWRHKVLTESMPKMLEGWKEPGDLIK